MKFAISAASLASGVMASKCLKGKAIVDLGSTHGPAEQLASGFLYGIPNNGTSASTAIPDHFYTEIGFRATRGGGSQTSDAGWTSGDLEAYRTRFNSTLSAYRTARKFNASYILIASGIWGADGGQDGSLYPGDDGDWTETDAFYTQLFSDMRENNMIDGIVFDIWNEPDYALFWERDWEQYLAYWNHAYQLLRENMPEVKIGGPAAAYSPNSSREKWHSFLATASGNNTIPDQYTWHHIGDDSTPPDLVAKEWLKLREQYNMPERLIDVNEYAWPYRQNPANTAWYLSQFERNDMQGLRANWGSRSDLHDRQADLLGKTEDGEYYPNGEWWLYKYYNEMEGERVITNASSDGLFDVFATVSKEGVVKIVGGTRTFEDRFDAGDYVIEIKGLTGKDGSIQVQSWRFDYEGAQAEIGPPLDLGSRDYDVTDGTLRLLYQPATNETAYAFEFSI
ncbi:glycosyl hydrolases family 39 domain-containing protein [Sarocladium implicatum]|nr:glycosyl hydrolases family 39 domain-containing protein [Sarocladium implicatum]